MVHLRSITFRPLPYLYHKVENNMSRTSSRSIFKRRGYAKSGAAMHARSRTARQAVFASRRGLALARAPVFHSVPQNIRTGGLLGVELKAFDTFRSNTTIANVDTWAGGEYDTATYGLFCPVQGTGVSTRDGNKCIVKSILVQGMVWLTQLEAQTSMRNPTLVQVALVMDMQTNGAQLSAEDVYVATNPAVPGLRVIENTSRFKVLKQFTVSLEDLAASEDGAGTCTIGGVLKPFTMSVKLNQPVNFINGAGAGAVADIKDVSFHIIAACNYNNSPQLEYNSRVRYVG